METPGKVYIRAYHNIEFSFLGYQKVHRITPVFETYESDADRDQLCARMFELLNVGDDPTYGQPDRRAVEYRMRRNRSLSVGDVIQIGKEGESTPEFYTVSSFGFDRIDSPHIVDTATMGTTPIP